MNRKLAFLLAGLTFTGVAIVSGAEAERVVVASDHRLTPDFFEHSRYEASITSGPLFSPFLALRNRPTVNYVVSELQLGYMLEDVDGHGWYRGNAELVGQLFGGGVFAGQGEYLAGMTLWLRYNFVPEKSALVPFVQGGAGITITDIDRRVIGQDFNFNLNIGVGARWFVAKDWSLNLELRYQHISNANLAKHNVGVNAWGPVMGVSYFF